VIRDGHAVTGRADTLRGFANRIYQGAAGAAARLTTTSYVVPFGLIGALDRLLDSSACQRAHLKDDHLDAIEWWEKRRFFYNKVLACVGTVTCVLMITCGLISEPLVGEAIGIPNPPALAPLGTIAYGIIANIFYTGGWIAELFLARFKTSANPIAFRARAFRIGLKFSIAVTLFPAVLSWVVLLVTFAFGPRGDVGH
jgi:hypothetical protein